jgi:hypothetical protein
MNFASNGAGTVYDTVERAGHPAEHRMLNPGLDVLDALPGGFLKPAAI